MKRSIIIALLAACITTGPKPKPCTRPHPVISPGQGVCMVMIGCDGNAVTLWCVGKP